MSKENNYNCENYYLMVIRVYMRMVALYQTLVLNLENDATRETIQALRNEIRQLELVL